MHFRTFFFIYISTNHINFLYFDNDDMKSSKRQVFFISLIFVLKCISKSILFRTKVSFKDFFRRCNRNWTARAFQNRMNHGWRRGGVERREGKDAQGGAATRLWGFSSNVTEQSLRDISAFLGFYNKRRFTFFGGGGGGGRGGGVGIYHAQTSKSKFLRTNLTKSSENKFVLC